MRECMPAYMVFTRERMRDEKEYEIYKQKIVSRWRGIRSKKTLFMGSMRYWKAQRFRGS
jgi:hypothetical protein